MWIGRAKSDLDRLADENWAWLKDNVNLPKSGWKSERLSRRDDPHISSISRRMSHKTAGCFTYKFQLQPNHPEGFGRHYQMQKSAFEKFPHSELYSMPRPVFVNEERQISLMAYLEGQPVSDVMKQCHSSSEQLDILKKCGEWLDAYHRSQTVEHRKFRPAHTIRYYDTLRERIKSGDHSVAARPLFMRGIKKLREIAPNYAGHDTIAAIQHGDFHLRNLVCDGHQIAGIDVSKDQPAVVGYDIAKILLDFTAVLRSTEGLQTGQIIHRETMDAFF